MITLRLQIGLSPFTTPAFGTTQPPSSDLTAATYVHMDWGNPLAPAYFNSQPHRGALTGVHEMGLVVPKWGWWVPCPSSDLAPGVSQNLNYGLHHAPGPEVLAD